MNSIVGPDINLHREEDGWWVATDEATATEGLERLEHDSQCGEEDDVHLGVAEEPEEVRPE